MNNQKRTVLTGLFLSAVLLLSGRLAAVEDDHVCGMVEKGSHGLVNLATGWFELPAQIVKGYNDGIGSVREAPARARSLGAVAGLFRGAAHAVGRTAWGAVELAGFWTLNPTTNTHLRRLLDGEYVWHAGEKKTMFDPSFDANLDRVALRLERGGRNLVGSVAELPGQIWKADAERCVYVGIPKGIWFATSRLIYGAGDLVLLPFPSPYDALGVPFDEVEGWDAITARYYSNVE